MTKIFSTFAAIFALLFLILALAFNPTTNAEFFEESIAKNRTISDTFSQAANYIDEFNRNNARLPSTNEFKRWAKTQPSKWPSAQDLFLETNPSFIQERLYNPHHDIDKTEDFGIPPDGSYILGLWRGEWFEYYISWHPTTTLTFDAKDYYILDTAVEDFTLFIFLFLICAALSIWLWRTSKKNSKALKNG
jgi:hypothetical protein